MTLNTPHPLDKIVKAQKRGEARGITSICSAHPTVLEATFRHALKNNTLVLIESTCNQVNQFGGYTGMKPVDFVAYVKEMADRFGFQSENLILGGDHLGPNVWQHEPAESAMDKSYQLTKDYIATGYSKIHLDASMKLGDDSGVALPTETIARRAAEMAKVAEDTFAECGKDTTPRYVIGTEVPIPGGAQDEDEKLQVSTIQDTRETLEITQRAFCDLGLEAAWERVIAVVVQPGVEFGDSSIQEYDRFAASELSRLIESQPLIYEAHSTDYQTQLTLQQMVEDHFAILKVGPALTFAYREVIFALAMIENELFPPEECSNLIDVLEGAMLSNPTHWQKYYHGDQVSQAFSRKYSYSDRSRYYWPVKDVQIASQKLLGNLGKKTIPLTLLSQYLPEQYARIRSGELENNPSALIRDKIISVLEDYHFAVSG